MRLIASGNSGVIPQRGGGSPGLDGQGCVKTALILAADLAYFREIVLTPISVDALVDGLTTGRLTWAQLYTAIEHLDGESAVDYLTQ